MCSSDLNRTVREDSVSGTHEIAYYLPHRRTGGKIIAGNIINFSREPVRRNEFIIGVAYDSDIDQVKQILTNIIQSEDRILKDREMTVRLNELGASSINFVVRVWSNSGDLQNVYWDVLERIKREFDAAGISFPYPQMDVNFKRVKEDKAV